MPKAQEEHHTLKLNAYCCAWTRHKGTQTQDKTRHNISTKGGIGNKQAHIYTTQNNTEVQDRIDNVV